VSGWSVFFGALVYLVGAIAFVVIYNADAESVDEATALLAASSVACGWLAKWWPAALLAFILVPLAEPFGYPESDFGEPAPVWAVAALVTLPSAGLILVATWAGRIWARRRGHRVPTTPMT
jgi:hypothetical protein